MEGRPVRQNGGQKSIGPPPYFTDIPGLSYNPVSTIPMQSIGTIKIKTWLLPTTLKKRIRKRGN
jgi:hypothetical protein